STVCSLSSFTRNMALGRSSTTVPENSIKSSLAIRSPCSRSTKGPPAEGGPSLWRGMISLRHGWDNRAGHRALSDLRRGHGREPLADASHQAVAHLAVGFEHRLAAALDNRRIHRVPELDLAGHGARELDRPVLRLGRERDDQVVGSVLEILEGLAAVAA